jgi:malonate decarboxylase beta subunit
MNDPASAEGLRRRLRARRSFVELNARERARALVDPGTFRELLGPFDRLSSPWLPPQGIVAQSDDGTVLVRGTLGGRAVLVIAIEGAFQGGSIGEVAAAKISGALELALGDCQRGQAVHPVLLLETGGVRLQEANLGLAGVAEIHAALLALRPHVPVVAVVAGMVGCFGGMAIAAGLCSWVIATRQGRLGLNGPEVIEEEAGVAEFDSRDRQLVWAVTGGARRQASGLVDALVEDDCEQMVTAIGAALDRGVPRMHASERVGPVRDLVESLPVEGPFDPSALRFALGDRPSP